MVKFLEEVSPPDQDDLRTGKARGLRMGKLPATVGLHSPYAVD
jgi:hypothetical protein